MKKQHLFTVLGLTLVSTAAKAQDSIKTLFSTPKINTIGLYVSPEYQFGQVQSEFTHLSGISGMLVFNQKFSVGISMNRTMVRDFSPKEVNPLYLRANYGGLKLEYTFKPTNVFHISVPLLVGMGMASTDSFAASGIRQDSFRISRSQYPGNRFFVVQPGIQIEANLFNYAKAYLGASYRFSFDTNNSTNLDASTFQGFGIYGGLKIGLFDYNIRKKNKQ